MLEDTASEAQTCRPGSPVGSPWQATLALSWRAVREARNNRTHWARQREVQKSTAAHCSDSKSTPGPLLSCDPEEKPPKDPRFAAGSRASMRLLQKA